MLLIQVTLMDPVNVRSTIAKEDMRTCATQSLSEAI